MTLRVNVIIEVNDINNNEIVCVFCKGISCMYVQLHKVLLHDDNNDSKAIIIKMYDNMVMTKLIESDDNDGWIDVVIVYNDVVYFAGQ